MVPNSPEDISSPTLPVEFWETGVHVPQTSPTSEDGMHTASSRLPENRLNISIGRSPVEDHHTTPRLPGNALDISIERSPAGSHYSGSIEALLSTIKQAGNKYEGCRFTVTLPPEGSHYYEDAWPNSANVERTTTTRSSRSSTNLIGSTSVDDSRCTSVDGVHCTWWYTINEDVRVKIQIFVVLLFTWAFIFALLVGIYFLSHDT